ncbi:ACP phosphodiesterase [Corallincola spongiicola]|uniref:DUF479 domain-containing protein n=1 Tax=Corallincola spongiicola TaxID=2520508 RepID=A0ABY1WKS3_9GAMM|nr:ACP phosphodiesterase [Corallincola spongiicola]TAA40389.1 DUF479 domain-containing protein [Corallincola spongiicola]
MNFLAHLHIADVTNTSAVGAMMGDFIKGDQWRTLPQAQRIGVLLHRQVDSFTDSHPDVIQARQLFKLTRQRYTGILIDMLFDHLLAKQWHKFHPSSLTQFSQQQYRQLTATEPHWPEKMIDVCRRMAETDWLCSYQTPGTIKLALHKIGLRMRVDAPFAASYQEWQQVQAELTMLFDSFYGDLLLQLPALQRNVLQRS